MKFLLQHHEELNLPYSFSVKLSFISSPLIFGKAVLIFSEESYEAVGAAGFVYGTGPNQYEDRHICQIETAFLRREYRCTSLFIKGLRVLIEEMKIGNPDVKLVQFWAAEDQAELDRLFSKFSAFPGANRFSGNHLVCCQIPFDKLEEYCRRFENRFEA